jgi:DNA polymerase-3 subunit beta
MKLTIEHAVIKALLLVAPKNDVRYYLKGVLVDVRAQDVTLVSTNGAVLLSVPYLDDVEGDRIVGQWIIPREALEAVKPCKVGRTVLPITVEINAGAETSDPDRPGVTIKALDTITITGATTTTTKPVEGRYPDWRRVMPVAASFEVAQFDPALVATFGDVHALLGGSEKFKPVIHHNGRGGALVSGLGRDALGVIMPLRIDADEMRHPGLPSWATA